MNDDDPPMGAGTVALMWALISLVVSALSWVVGTGIYLLVRSAHG